MCAANSKKLESVKRINDASARIAEANLEKSKAITAMAKEIAELLKQIPDYHREEVAMTALRYARQR